MGQKTEKSFWDEKQVLLQKENKVPEQNKRYHNILTIVSNYFPLNQKEKFVEKKQLIFKNTRNCVLEGLWMGTTTTTKNMKAIILIIGQTSCGKTTFIQKLAKKQNFWKTKGDTLDIENTCLCWKRKKHFVMFPAACWFKYKFNMHLTFFQRKRHVDDNIDIVMGENNIFDKLYCHGWCLRACW